MLLQWCVVLAVTLSAAAAAGARAGAASATCEQVTAADKDSDKARLCQMHQAALLIGRLSDATLEGIDSLLLQSGVSTEDDGIDGVEKRKHEYLRLGKRKHEYLRLGKRKHEFLRFGGK